MKLLVDMNLSPRWVDYLKAHGYEVRHWSETGAPDAADRTIMQWAKENGCVVFTHDLDFSALLAATQADGPSVLQVRAQDVMPEAMGATVLQVLHRFEPELLTGALLSVDPHRARVRLLPFGS
ncbi:DUF5615 family PIN-like protein [Rhodocaloribacter sp.]